MTMNIKKITQKLSKVRDNTSETGKISEADKDALRALVQETIDNAQSNLAELPKNISSFLPIADNDNQELTSEQKFRLRLIEKTGTGSASIH